MSEVAHPTHQPPGDARRAAAAPRDFARAALVDSQFEQSRPAGDHLEQFVLGVEIEPHRNPETIA